jgi:AcrR family transcriptional regulator
VTVSSLGSRRAERKAATRERIRTSAQALFAESGFDPVTVSDVAAEAGVSVQTVFNHFASKEELFFEGHTPWVTGGAEAVRGRAGDETPVEALRGYLAGLVAGYARRAATPAVRRRIELMAESPALRAHERGLVDEAIEQTSQALRKAWDLPDGDTVVADLTAAVWLTTVRTVVLDMRRTPPDPSDETAVQAVADLTASVLGELERGLATVGPHFPVRRTG